jgi:hypothetical protein
LIIFLKTDNGEIGKGKKLPTRAVRSYEKKQAYE